MVVGLSRGTRYRSSIIGNNRMTVHLCGVTLIYGRSDAEGSMFNDRHGRFEDDSSVVWYTWTMIGHLLGATKVKNDSND